MRLKLAGAALLALGTLAGSAGNAEARDGCGPGFHRGFYGYCRPNLYGPRFYGYGPAFYGPRWHGGWHRRWGGWHHHAGWHRHWGGGWRHAGWHHGGWHHRW